MNTLSHLLMGKFLCEYVKKQYGIILDSKSFIFGNILPDFTLSFIIKPHLLENYTGNIHEEIDNLISQKQISSSIGHHYSEHLGIICHYYTDFFCFAHSKKFKGNLFEHIKYERSLYQFMCDKFEIIKKVDFTAESSPCKDTIGIYGRFKKMHENYIYAKPSFDNDLIYSILACVEVIVSITNCSVVEISDEFPLCYTNQYNLNV